MHSLSKIPLFIAPQVAFSFTRSLNCRALSHRLPDHLRPSTMPKPSVLPATRLASELDAESFDTNVEAPVVPRREALRSAEVLRVKLLTQTAKAPVRGSPLSAGFDLSASEACVIKAGERGIVKTGLQISIPVGCYGRVAPRSGLAVKKFIDTGAGVIDADYRGEVGVVLFNFGNEDFQVDIGDRVAQLVLERICMAPVQVVDELDITERGSGGFGSTGVNDKPQK